MIRITMHGTIPHGISETLIRRVVRETFQAARRTPQGDITVAFVTDRKIATLNAQYRGHRRPTDVLSFSSPSIRHSSFVIPSDHQWGDILIAPTYSAREAKRHGVPFAQEILRLVAHGTLHLLGYDHATLSGEKRMFGIQEKAIQKMNA